ncbi:FMN-dependent oxidoreductase, nitrilotriacetate monooxygenase family [Roseovarius pacificus]|uniref:FMN-dependent oxidoreductase, nitrilotriacetate monooxygenase family n=2 Tax=Roseovarius pacificus TaxID=337701 RepID=A0A1M7BCZ5_9RHOB|nr:FMN-dependent oxidoreductase, nitrilotriacetate monooxygenase family [Roseovarius pacificus]
MKNGKKMHIGTLMTWAGTHVGGWRMPDAEHGGEDLDVVVRCAQIAERGKLDFVFFADGLATSLDFHPSSMLHLEPLTLLGALAVSTSHIGLAATVSTTYSEPYNVARMLASIDHMSKGRAGWNVVTGSQPEAAANFSKEKHPPHAERYAVAEEYLSVAKGLWDTWEEGAVVADKATGQYIEPSKMHVLDHTGAYFKVRGPLNITRPPQGYPVILQAGASEAGLNFAARTAEVVFASQQDIDEAIAFAEDLRDRCEKAGRPRDAIKILPGLAVVLGETQEDARNKLNEMSTLVDPVAAMKVLSDRLGEDMSRYSLDEPVAELPESTLMQGHARVLTSMARRKNLTLRELRDLACVATGHRVAFGTPEEIADDMEEWFRRGAADGFMIKTAYLPAPLDEFVDQVIPILQKRGLFREEYEGTTLRDHLGLPRPAHPGARSEAAITTDAPAD